MPRATPLRRGIWRGTDWRQCMPAWLRPRPDALDSELELTQPFLDFVYPSLAMHECGRT